MKIYYFVHQNTEGKQLVKAFTSKTEAKKHLAELKKEVKEIRKRWEDYIVSGKRGERPPDYIRGIPDEVTTVEFERTSEGLREAFTYLVNKEQLCK